MVYAVFSCTPDGHKLPLCFFHRDKFKQADTWVVESGDYWWTCKLHDLSPVKLVEWRPVH